MMSLQIKDSDLAFQGAGREAGLDIWCVENLRLVPITKSSHGKFYSGSAYVVMSTVLRKEGSPQYDIHYWLGNDANEADSVLASDKALELDAVLGSCAVQYQEFQGHETEKFLSYFKPCIIPIEGRYLLQPGRIGGTYQNSLLTCKGNHTVRVKEVPFSRSSLNHNDVFVLDTASKIFLFSGSNSTIQERAKALEVVMYIKDNKHGGKCQMATIEDGKLSGDPDVGEFWSLFGGYAPIPRDSLSDAPEQSDIESVKLCLITAQQKLYPVGINSLSKDLLEKGKCYMLDCGAEVFVWMGRETTITERKLSISAAENLLKKQGRSTRTHLSFCTEGLESATFRSFFNSWPQVLESRLYSEGREKVAAIFKQQGYNVNELPEEDSEPCINCRGILNVWLINGEELSPLSVPEQTKLYSGDYYIVQYTYLNNGRDENLFYAWLGRGSVMEDRVDAISHASTLIDSTKGGPVLAQVIEDKEPIQFFLIFRTLIILKGGRSLRYSKFMAEKGIAVKTYDTAKTALFRVQGTSPSNMQAIQVDPVSNSLNSSYCYILQSRAFIFTWIGNLSSTLDHDLLDRMLEIINPTWQSVSVREGSEPDSFWNVLGGKGEYPREKERKKITEEPHLFVCTCTTRDFKVKEIYNFVQDDLTTEDMFLLDCQSELYVWIGRNSNVTQKQEALNRGRKFLEMDILFEGLCPETPVYVVAEGHEPPLFTRFFLWDPLKANMHGNSFERKLAALKGKPQIIEEPSISSWKAYAMDKRPDQIRSKSVSSNGWGRSVSPAPRILGAKLRSSENKFMSGCTPSFRKPFSGSSSNGYATDSPTVKQIHPSGNGKLSQVDESEMGIDSLIFSYQQLKVDSKDSPTDIDLTKREAYLSKTEFEEKFRMTKTIFYSLPKWKQNKTKMDLLLF